MNSSAAVASAGVGELTFSVACTSAGVAMLTRPPFRVLPFTAAEGGRGTRTGVRGRCTGTGGLRAGEFRPQEELPVREDNHGSRSTVAYSQNHCRIRAHNCFSRRLWAMGGTLTEAG